MRRLLAGTLVASALVVLGAAWAGPARAEDVIGTVERVGWWTKRLGAQPTTQAGSFEIAFGTDAAPTSVAAIDVALPVAPVQTMQISLGELTGTAAQVGHIRVCLAAPGWATANGAPFEQAPQIDCSTGAADLTRTLEGNWLGDIGGLLPNGGTASLGFVLVDDLGAPVSPGATVQVSDIAIEGQTGDAPATTTTTLAPLSGVGEPGFDPPSVFVPDTGGSFAVPPLAPADVGDGSTGSTTTTSVPETLEVAAPAFDRPGRPWGRLVLIVPLAVGLGFAAVFARRRLTARGISFA